MLVRPYPTWRDEDPSTSWWAEGWPTSAPTNGRRRFNVKQERPLVQQNIVRAVDADLPALVSLALLVAVVDVDVVALLLLH